MKTKVLVITEYYIPSVKGGGPIRSIKNLVDNLSDRVDFYIVAADRDLGDDTPFSGIKTDAWLDVGSAKVIYSNPVTLWHKIASIMNSVEYDLLYLNTFFSLQYSAIPILINKCKRKSKKTVVVPRGQFAPGALGLKHGIKSLYIRLVKILGIYKNIVWHATAESEKKEIKVIFGNKAKIEVVNNLTADYKKLEYNKNIEKKSGELRIVFVSRVHPKKNLRKAIELLKDIDGKIEFNIYGPIENKAYWAECENVIGKLGTDICVSYKGIVAHENIMNIVMEHHVFLFPTLGENFGHVISEALIGGCPVIISDRTPWRGLEEKQVGWDIGLKDENKFVEVLQYCVDMGDKEYKELSRNAFEYGKKEAVMSTDTLDVYWNIFGYNENPSISDL